MGPETKRVRADAVRPGDRIAYRWVTCGIDRWLNVTAPLAVDVRLGPGHGWHIMCDGYPYVVAGADALVEVAAA